MSGTARVKTGSYIGTGAALDLRGEKVGFQPSKVEIYRMATRFDKSEHVAGMAADSLILDKGDDGVRSHVTSQAITLHPDGFSVGTNAAVNTDGTLYHFVVTE